jgi:release factor glutamine methyltransferase
MTNTVAESLGKGVRTLTEHSESPRLDAELLLGKVLEASRSALIVRAAEAILPDLQRAYEDLIARRAAGAPMAYLTGTREFWSLPLHVTPDVLVPRPDTETLVELALAHLPPNEQSTVLDLGTGSGAIALALASERPRARIVGTDLCARALAVARDNAHALGLARVDWRLGSWFDAVAGERFDMIVANPPYIAAADPALASLAAEPALALAAGPTGLEALEAIVENSAAHLNPSGWILLEHGSTQAPDVAAMLKRRGFADVSSHLDASGRSRVTLGQVTRTGQVTHAGHVHRITGSLTS